MGYPAIEVDPVTAVGLTTHEKGWPWHMANHIRMQAMDKSEYHGSPIRLTYKGETVRIVASPHAHEVRAKNLGGRASARALSEDAVRTVRYLLTQDLTIKEISLRTGVNATTVRYIRDGKRYADYGLIETV